LLASNRHCSKHDNPQTECNVSLSAIACAIDIYKFAFAIDMAINIGHALSSIY